MAICQKLKIILFLISSPNFHSISTKLYCKYVGQRENPKMCNILKTTDRRAKWTKLWDSGRGYYSAYICRVLLMPDSLSLVCGHLVHFAIFPVYNFQNSPNFHPISTKLYCKYMYVGHEGISAMTFLAICQELKILWHFEIFANTGPYGAGNFKTLLLQFLNDLSQTLSY